MVKYTTINGIVMRRGKRGLCKSSVAFCYYLEPREKVRSNFGSKCSKDKKYRDFSGTDRNIRMAPLQVNLLAIVLHGTRFQNNLYLETFAVNSSPEDTVKETSEFAFITKEAISDINCQG